MIPKTAKSGRSERRMRSSLGRRAAKTPRKTKNAKNTRHSARIDGSTPALNAALAMMPPIPKKAAAVSARL
jgi:hypothetical protein